MVDYRYMMLTQKSLLLAAFVSLVGCSSAKTADVTPTPDLSSTDPLPPPPPEKGFQMGMEIDSPAHSETWKCQMGTLPIDGPRAVNAVEHVQSAVVHHMDIIVIATSGVDLPDGIYDCADIYKDHPKLMEEVILYAAQKPQDKWTFPKGTAAMVPGPLRVMYEIHHVNGSDQPMHLFSKVNAYSVSTDEVTKTVWGGPVRNRNLTIPPKSDVTEVSRCVFDKDVDILIMSMHTHKLGRDMTALRFDGTATGEQVYKNEDWAQPAVKSFTDAPLHVAKGQGFEFRCHYANPSDKLVNWGFKADDEMCNLALVYTPGDSAAKCTQVYQSGGKIIE